MELAINLSGDFLCPFQLLLDLNRQLSQPVDSLCYEVFKPICELETTNDWINLEALGKPDAIRASQFCELIQGRLPDTFNLHVMMTQLSRDNLYALIFLARAKKKIKLHCYSLGERPKEFESHLESQGVELIFYEDAEQAPELIKKRWQEDLLTRESLLRKMNFPLDYFWLESAHSSSQSGALIAYSWVCLKSGAHQIGCNALEKALSHLNLSPKTQELFFMHLQLIRFLSHQYALVTQVEFPEKFNHLSQEDAHSLCFIKAYAATMCRNIDVADKFFARCGVNEKMELSEIHTLYRMNLFALSQVIKGKISVAFSLEMKIENFIQEHDIGETGLRYVNFINIARLYKKSGQYKESLKYYHKAYEQISGGGYTESDLIYYHMNLGSLYEASGNHDSALKHWVNAAIHWVALDNKYALAWRPRIILSQERLTDILKPLSIAKASQFLLTKVSQLAKQMRLELNTVEASFQFTHEFSNQSRASRCYVINGLILSDNKGGKENGLNQEEYTQKLTEWVSCYLSTRAKVNPESKSLSIPTRFEVYYPSDEQSCLDVAQLMGCQRCVWEGRELNIDVRKKQLENKHEGRLVLSSAIDSVDVCKNGLKLIYKRSFLNKTLTDEASIKLIKTLMECGEIKETQSHHFPEELIERLSKERILYRAMV